FSMGNDLADVNNDGLIDIVSLDMLPENLETYKTSGLEYPYPIYQNYLRNGYAPQFMQNSLHLNLGNENFAEIGNLAGISATEWSWGALLADYDNDGLKDIFISNGIKGATNDMDFINFIANENIQKRIDQGMTREDMAFISEMPHKKVPNYFFKNQGDLTFRNVTQQWYRTENSYSNGSVYADLDNDGDLDVVVNNIDEEAFVLENKSDEKQNGHYLKIGFKGVASNPFGIGTKVILYHNGSTLTQENFTGRGYLSAVSPELHFGVGKDSLVDSLRVIWPGGAYQTFQSVETNRRLLLNQSEADGNFYAEFIRSDTSYLNNATDFLGFVHKDASTLEFDRDPLVPYANTNQGPAISVADINGDKRQDVFIGGAKGQASQLFVQHANATFHPEQQALFEKDAISEDVTQVFFDADGDDDQDLLVASGGNEFKTGNALRPRFYRNTNGKFEKEKRFPNLYINASKVDAVDFDADGDMDLTLASDQIPHQFGATPQNYLFENDGLGNFKDVTKKIAPEFQNLGNIKDFVWTDLDGNGYQDLIAVGHWMPISIFLNDGTSLELQSGGGLSKTHGWWNSLAAADFDNDGDTDFVAGNWGLNSKFDASAEKPITLYRTDFDDNGSVEPVITHFEQGKETPFASKDELVKQLPYLNKKFLSYSDFAKANIEDLLPMEKLEAADQKTVYNLHSMYFENVEDGHFKGSPLPMISQASTIHDIAVDDFDSDGFKDLLIVGNTHEISTQLGRMDASHGLILRNDSRGGFEWLAQQEFDVKGPARSIEKMELDGKDYYIIGINNGVPVFLTKEE
ncbi:MAG: VCBS repeat-containing protein, partial [Pricia sp.]